MSHHEISITAHSIELQNLDLSFPLNLMVVQKGVRTRNFEVQFYEMTSKLRAELCRIRLFPRLISKLKWTPSESELPLNKSKK